LPPSPVQARPGKCKPEPTVESRIPYPMDGPVPTYGHSAQLRRPNGQTLAEGDARSINEP
jgi:hypothetical protein